MIAPPQKRLPRENVYWTLLRNMMPSPSEFENSLPQDLGVPRTGSSPPCTPELLSFYKNICSRCRWVLRQLLHCISPTYGKIVAPKAFQISVFANYTGRWPRQRSTFRACTWHSASPRARSTSGVLHRGGQSSPQVRRRKDFEKQLA